MLEKTERAIINGQSRETGEIRHLRYRTKTNKTKNTTQKTKMDEQHKLHQKTADEPGCS
jgi:hypothetical protein